MICCGERSKGTGGTLGRGDSGVNAAGFPVSGVFVSRFLVTSARSSSYVIQSDILCGEKKRESYREMSYGEVVCSTREITM